MAVQNSASVGSVWHAEQVLRSPVHCGASSELGAEQVAAPNCDMLPGVTAHRRGREERCGRIGKRIAFELLGSGALVYQRVGFGAESESEPAPVTDGLASSSSKRAFPRHTHTVASVQNPQSRSSKGSSPSLSDVRGNEGSCLRRSGTARVGVYDVDGMASAVLTSEEVESVGEDGGENVLFAKRNPQKCLWPCACDPATFTSVPSVPTAESFDGPVVPDVGVPRMEIASREEQCVCVFSCNGG